MRDDYAREAALRSASAGGRLTPEDAILHALLGADPPKLAESARLVAETQLLDRDYLEYWVDELGLRERWRSLR